MVRLLRLCRQPTATQRPGVNLLPLRSMAIPSFRGLISGLVRLRFVDRGEPSFLAEGSAAPVLACALSGRWPDGLLTFSGAPPGNWLA